MPLVIKKSECKRREDYLPQIEREIDAVAFQTEIKSCRIISRKDIEKRILKKSQAVRYFVTDAAPPAGDDSFEEIANNDKTFITRISKN